MYYKQDSLLLKDVEKNKEFLLDVLQEVERFAKVVKFSEEFFVPSGASGFYEAGAEHDIKIWNVKEIR